MNELKEIAEAQGAILETFPDEAAREAWALEHGGTFRALWDTDSEFKRFVADRNVAEMLRRIEEAERAKRS